MNLINRLANKIKYEKPTADIVTCECEDILKSSAEKNDTEKNNEMEMRKNVRNTSFFEPSFYEKYPDGLPLEVLKLIDFKHFGAILKQKQLLPPSYDRKPTNVVFDEVWGYPRVILEFQSKTSDSIRFVGICRYSVAYSENKEDTYVMQIKPLMIAEWRNFAEHVMWAWERGFNYALVPPEKNLKTFKMPLVNETSIQEIQEIEKKREMAQNLMQEDMDYIESVKEIAKWNKKAIEAEEKDL